MHRFALLPVLFAAFIQLNTAQAQSAEDRVLVDVDTCIDLATREAQLECYEQRVNEALEARGREPSTGAPASSPAGADASSASDESRASRRAERREARDIERRNREVQRREREAAEAAQRAEEAALAAAEAAAAINDENFTPGEIVARIVEFEEREPDAYIITLDNGQVWRQSAPKRYLLLEGAEVRLRPTRFGPSYRLTDPNVGGFIQVRRLN